MSAADERDTSPQAERQRALIAEIEARLAQYGRLTAQIRESLPEHHAQDLTRIEQGIDSLTHRISALEREKGRAQECVALPPSPTVAPGEDEPWDPHSAEELMRVYENICAEAAAPAPGARPHSRPGSSQERAAAGAPQPPLRDAAWLEARFAEIAALIERALTDANPAPALASLDRRLDQFERRLDGALDDMAPAAGRGDLKLIDAHLVEFAGQVEAVRQQLNRLDTIDAQLRELAHAMTRGEEARASQSARNEDALAELIASAAERAASKVAQSLPALDEHRIDALEALVREHVAERRRSEEASAGVLHSIEDALVRIVDRIEAMEAMRPSAYADGTPRDCDGVQTEHDRLVQVYAEGARVLGQPTLPPTLDAADYVVVNRQQQRATAIDLPAQPAADDWTTQDETARHELRASALRARPNAQARAPALAEDVASDEVLPKSLAHGLLGDGSLGQGRLRRWALAKANYRASLLLGVVMALLFGAGFMAIDSMLAAAPAPAEGQGRESTPPPASRAGDAQFSPGPKADRPEAAPLAQPTPRQPLPDAASEDRGEDQSAPTPRLERLQRGTASLPASAPTPSMVAPPDSAASPAGAVREGTDATSARFTPNLSPSEAEDNEIAAPDPRQAFAWYERAAARGLAAAQFRLALALERGIGVGVDRERAKVWYGRAAEQGHVRAMHNLGVLLAAGERADDVTAARWFAQAAERGLADSQFNLAVLHESGRGVTKDLKQAYFWFALAAKSGDPAAVRRLEQVAAQLQPAELAAAEQSVAAWHPTEIERAGSVTNTSR
jgi:localization factor PodJL